MGSGVWVLNLFPTNSEKYDPQSMCARYVEPNKYSCEIIGPQNPPHI